MKLSLVVPCYNEEDVIYDFYKETKRVFENKVENDVPARYAVRVPVIQIAGNRVVPRVTSSLLGDGDFFMKGYRYEREITGNQGKSHRENQVL